MSFMVANINKETRALQASKVAKHGELQTCKAEAEAYKGRIKALEAQLKVCIAAVNNGGSDQVSTAPKENAPRLPAFPRARSARVAFFGDSNPTLG